MSLPLQFRTDRSCGKPKRNKRRRAAAKSRHQRRLLMEPLEARILLAIGSGQSDQNAATLCGWDATDKVLNLARTGRRRHERL